MHNNRIRAEDIALELGVTPSYVSMILNGKRNPPGAKEKMEAAVSSIIKHRADQKGE
jgi:predicted transcriptional regulator